MKFFLCQGPFLLLLCTHGPSKCCALVPREVVAAVSAREVMPAGWLAGWLCTFTGVPAPKLVSPPASLAAHFLSAYILAHYWHTGFTGTPFSLVLL